MNPLPAAFELRYCIEHLTRLALFPKTSAVRSLQ
jgi:hypothetical protein